MKNSERALGNRLQIKLTSFDANNHPLPGIDRPETREAFIEQLIDSIRRVRYLAVMRSRQISNGRADPLSDSFDPLRAAELQRRRGNLDEAFWLVFLAIYCGKNGKSGWRLARDLYGGLQQAGTWTWARVSGRPQDFEKWVRGAYLILSGGDGVRRGFGNHRQYESLRPDAPKSPAKVIASYVAWVNQGGGHIGLINEAKLKTDGHPRSVFNYMYRSMNVVLGFGRLARFDYLTMIGKMGLADIEADSAYMQGATGPLTGGRLLFRGAKNAALQIRELDQLFLQLGDYLNVGPQAMQVMEDAVCNWQKSPDRYLPFKD
jgi:hypothetical protein